MLQMATIETACELVTDGTHYTPKNVGEGIPFLTVKDVSAAGLDFVDCSYITESDYQVALSGNSAPMKGDVLFSKDGTVGKVHVVTSDRPFAVLSSLAILRPKDGFVDPRYLGHVLRSPDTLNEALKKKTGSAIRRIILSDLKRVRVYLPPLLEQRRIAAILDQAEMLRSKRQEALVHLDSLVQSVFNEMFGDITRNQKKFPKIQIGSIAKISSGSTPSRGNEGYYGGAIPWVKTTEVSGRNIYSTEEKITDAGFKAIRGKLHPIDSIIVAMYGQGQTRGRSALLKVKAACNQACGVIYPSKEFLPDFMFHQIRLSYNELRSLGRGGNQENLNLQLLGAFEVLLPPMDVQQTFITRVRAIDGIKANHTASLDELNALFFSLQHRAFRGKL